jgi:hypothetical protein
MQQAIMPYRKSTAAKSLTPVCVECDVYMEAVESRTNDREATKLQRRAFRCPVCKAERTYTVGGKRQRSTRAKGDPAV